MQLRIRFKLIDPLELPVSYNHIVQSGLLNLGRNDDSEYAKLLHETSTNGRVFRFFCFSQLFGKCSVANNKIIFSESIELEVRSVSSSWIREVCSQVTKKGMIFGNKTIFPEWIEIADKKIFTDTIRIRMLSPIEIHTTDRETNKTRYYSPEELDFYSLINTNFINKWQSYYGEEPERGIEINKINVLPKDKRVTKYKGYFVITAWGGEYVLQGTPAALNFLYNTGLGTRNSQGFGMMEII